MAVGGMIGGGIFSVLGVGITLAGHLAFGTFVIGGAIAVLTAKSFAGVTARAGSSGGPFDHLRRQGHPELAGTLLWLLVFGYMVAMAVYAFTFGRYVADALDASTWIARAFSIGVVALFLVVNMRGVRLSSLAEDLIVLTKLAILGGIGLIGLAHFTPTRLEPVGDKGVGGMFLGAATVFFAYEGFELICYDRDDMVDPERTLPRSIYLSVAIVAAVYVGVTLGAQMLVADHTIVADESVAFIEVGRAALGGAGRWAAIIGAVFATGSAINATLFSCGRLIRDATRTGDLPEALGRETDGLPVVAMAFISVVGAGMAMLPGITTIIVFGSAAFLAIYTIVNGIQAAMAPSRAARWIAGLAALSCVAAIVALLVELARDDRRGLVILVTFAGAISLGRWAFVRNRSPG
jgi:amino acid transporter